MTTNGATKKQQSELAEIIADQAPLQAAKAAAKAAGYRVRGYHIGGAYRVTLFDAETGTSVLVQRSHGMVALQIMKSDEVVYDVRDEIAGEDIDERRKAGYQMMAEAVCYGTEWILGGN